MEAESIHKNALPHNGAVRDYNRKKNEKGGRTKNLSLAENKILINFKNGDSLISFLWVNTHILKILL